MSRSRQKPQPGGLYRQVVLHEPTVSTDSIGQVVISWTSKGKHWAGIEFQHGSAKVVANEPVESEAMVLKLRHGSGIQNDWKVVYGSENWRVISVRPLDRNQWQEAKCERMGGSESGR